MKPTRSLSARRLVVHRPRAPKALLGRVCGCLWTLDMAHTEELPDK
jgi:hypothetical protein